MPNENDNSLQLNYNSHAKFLAEIALSILQGNTAVLGVNGVKEIIALYLLIPYITQDQLITPGEGYIVPKLDGEFCDGINLKNLRDAICHSFVTIEEDRNYGTYHGKYLVFDDRIVLKRREHDLQGNHSANHMIQKEFAHKRLEELFLQVLSQ